MIFDRLAAVQRERDWVLRRRDGLRDTVLPAIRGVYTALQTCRPIAASEQFATELDAVVDGYGELYRR